MALTTYNAKLEYAPHVIKLWNEDADGVPEDFDSSTVLYIKRQDDGTKVGFPPSIISVDGTGYIEIPINLTMTTPLYKDGDRVFDYDNDKGSEHIWSLESNSRVYISGTMKLLESAGT